MSEINCKSITYHEVLPNSNNTQLVELGSNLDLNRISDLKEFFDQSFEQGYSRFLVDLSKVPFLYSSVLGVMIGTAKRSKSLNGFVKLCRTSPALRCALQYSGFSHQIEIYECRESALRSIKAN